jgi:selenide,water dikinase
MAQASGVTLEIVADSVPVLPGTIDMIGRKFLTAGGHTNRVLIEGDIEWTRAYDETLDHLLLDPQTSGGLLISVAADRCEGLFSSIQEVYPDAAVIGGVIEKRGVSLQVV